MATAKFVKTLRMTSKGTTLERAEVIERGIKAKGQRYGHLIVQFADGTKQSVSTHPDFTIAIKEA